MPAPRGASLVELLAALVVLALLTAAALPSLERMRRAERLGAGARTLALTFQALRWRSVAESRAYGLQFRDEAGRSVWYVVRDGDGDGLGRADVDDGTDPVVSGPHPPLAHDRSVRFGVPAGPAAPGIPPSGSPPDPADPLRFGAGDLVVFTPGGSASGGTAFLTDGRDLAAVVLYGPTARVRVWELREGRWSR